MSTPLQNLRRQIDGTLKQIFGTDMDLIEITQISGGSISSCLHACTSHGDYFLKSGGADSIRQLRAEADALRWLQKTSFRVPRVLTVQTIQGGALLVMEYLRLRPVRDWEAYAGALVALHRMTHSQFGWHQNNYIGATDQQNPWCTDWAIFWQQARLAPQLTWAKSKLNSEDIRSLKQILDAVPNLLANHKPICALTHGDLWSGNMAETIEGQPALFDPALYYGDRETDLAMTELFGGVSPSFYQAYNSLWPLDSGYELRKLLYNLYHLLNHLNMFGTDYLTATRDLINELRAHL